MHALAASRKSARAAKDKPPRVLKKKNFFECERKRGRKNLYATYIYHVTIIRIVTSHLSESIVLLNRPVSFELHDVFSILDLIGA